MKENPTENRIFTGSDQPLNAEQLGNLLKSTEFNEAQHNRIRDIAGRASNPRIEAQKRMQQMFVSIELIRPTKDGDLLVNILKCRCYGYSHKKIAKTLMKSDRDLPSFSSITKAIKFVEEAEREGRYRVNVALTNKNRIITP